MTKKCGKCGLSEKMIENLKKELRSQKTNIIRELKKNHPKGFCYICGKIKSTIHHLRDMNTHRRKGKVNGEIPLCRYCHDILEDCKVRMKKFQKIKNINQQRTEQIYKIIEEKMNEYNKYYLKAHDKKEKHQEDIFYSTYSELKELLSKIRGEK